MENKHISCPKCHNLTQADFPYCNYCGAKLENITELEEVKNIDNNQKPNRLTIPTIIMLMIGVAFVVMAIISIALRFNFNDKYIYSLSHDTKNIIVYQEKIYIWNGCMIAFLTLSCVWWIIFFPIIQGVRAYLTPEAKAERRREAEERERKWKLTIEKENWKLENIKKTVILNTITKTNNKDALKKGVMGDLLFGTAGAIVGTKSAKAENHTIFLIIYNDDSRETREVQNGTEMYNLYIKFLEV